MSCPGAALPALVDAVWLQVGNGGWLGVDVMVGWVSSSFVSTFQRVGRP